MYTVEQIQEAMETLKELVAHQTGLSEDKIIWTPDSMTADLINILTGKPMITAEIAEMRRKPEPMF